MTSHDVRDVLNLPSDNAGPRPSKKARTAAPRPNLKGLAREVQNLGGDNPIAIVPEVSVFKKRRTVSRKPAAKWELKAFTNSARVDDGALVLRHWKRKPDGTEGGQDGSAEGQNSAASAENSADKPEDSSFAKFNVRVSVPQYSEDQYNTNLKHPDWTKEETDYLLELAKDFDLRWPIIWDRYEYAPQQPEGEIPDGMAVVPAPKPRTMEDLKARYYEVAAKMMAVQKPAQYMTRPEFELYEMMLHFDPKQEQNRKRFAENTLKRSNEEAREEEALLLEIKRIMARTERFNEERRELYNRLDYPASESDINSFKTSAGLQSLLQTLLNVDKSKKRKSIMGPENGVPPAAAAAAAAAAPAPPAAAAAAAAVAPEAPPAASRRESLAASSTAGANDHHEPPAREPPVRHERQESRSHHRNESRSERADRHGGHGHHQRDSVSQTPAATPAEPPTPAPAPAPAANKKKGPQQPERRKLSENEEQVYGVSHHDRLGSGPTFRYEKINKLYSHKSGQQQMRITNLLLELDIPARLIMPTAAVTAQFEVLWTAVTALVDLRKVSDKVDAEIKLEEAKKAERERKEAEERGETVEKKDGEEGEGEGGGGEAGGAGDKEKDDGGGDDAKNKSGESSAQTDEEKKDQMAEDTKAQKEQQGEGGQDQQKKDGEDLAAATKDSGGGDKSEKTGDAAAGDKEAESSSNQPKIKEEADENGTSNGAGAGSGTQHKRSASVLSNTSERSTKKQKK
ncbi:hypothetical protein SMACR_06178 [Sordaria macrospora]|uniref:SWR1-complex protein 4 n=2 Tax=Sordaria macrospora TaxID=5147 RepID=F7W697_SORMK|nr:uncharacterized protein SMAC_06178 [Sordaria macrospora k-hell]KAA8633412.1 hypothetical protein SMACR_06178 [Sordaria macrospora]KAH7630296.1 hypothetical protein B0T09DRAFT_341460 [Sordaria sp. MPI-SDFR-AT-0083]WPJ66963.1 hypothetical protein SMAC4_06178 [Sordaria macrospora]CCC13035.1 unnamed protein product [Sordaria macrospora k-hell]